MIKRKTLRSLETTASQCSPKGVNGSVKLTCGLVLRPPPPRVSTDCLIPIKAGDLQKEDALDAGEQACFPKLEVANDRFAPTVVGTTAEHYKNVARAWAAPRPDVQGLLDFWADSLFWISSPSGKSLEGCWRRQCRRCASRNAISCGRRRLR